MLFATIITLLLLVNGDYNVNIRFTKAKDCTSTPYNLAFNYTATPCTSTSTLSHFLSRCITNPDTPATLCTPTIPSFYSLLKKLHPNSSFINMNHFQYFSENSYDDTHHVPLQNLLDTCTKDILFAFGFLTDYCIEMEHVSTKYMVRNTSIYQVIYQMDQKGCVGEITRGMKHRWHDVDECYDHIQAIYYENYNDRVVGISSRNLGLFVVSCLIMMLYYTSFTVRDLTKSISGGLFFLRGLWYFKNYKDVQRERKIV